MKIRWFSLIRVTGMVMVFLYHLFQSTFRGGFVGVDLFFTFSGFLTTAVFLDEFAKHDKIDLIGFFRRRLYRILPPLIVAVLIIVPLALFIRRDFLAGIDRQVAAALGFVTNYYEISLGGSYENQFVPHLLLHTWTLAVEVHVYVIWGLLLWFLAKRSKSGEQIRSLTFVLSAIFLTITLVGMIAGAANAVNLSAVYYATSTHSFPFFIGALLACLTGLHQTTLHFKEWVQAWTLKTALSVFGGGFLILAILMFALEFDNKWTYWIGFLLASLATAAMILAARILHEKTTRREPRFLAFLADISYGVYLFHWPLSIIFGEWTKSILTAVLTLVFSILLASLSFYLIEPLLMGKKVLIRGREFALDRLKRFFSYLFGPLLLITAIAIFTAPKVGDLETDLMVSSLQQADSKMTQTRNLAENKKATDYGVLAGSMIIGDSVTLRASDGLAANNPNIMIDGEVSRTLAGAYEVMKVNANSGSLPQNVIIAAGTNPSEDYAAQLDKIVAELPKGHRLILVTPYDGRVAGDSSAIPNRIRDYESSLVEKYDWITLADWYQTATDNPQIWQNTDQVHFGENSASINEGQGLYGQLVAQALSKADSGPVKVKN